MKELVKRFQETLDYFPEVRFAGDPILRQIAEEVSLTEGVLLGQKLGEVLLRYRKIYGYGRGLAAPQIGESKAVFITFVDERVETFINPKIVERASGTNFYKELCLSCGIVAADVERPEWIVMQWTGEDGVQHDGRFDGFLARLYQHEEAHLRGKLNLDEAAEGGIEFALFDPLKEQLRNRRNSVL